MKIKLDITAEDLKKKLNLKDGEPGKPGKDGEDAIPPDISVIALEASKMAQDELLPLIPRIDQIEADLPKLGTEIRDSLELLKDDERLDKKAIKGLEILDEIPDIKRIAVHNNAKIYTGISETRARELITSLAPNPSIGGNITGGTNGSVLFINPANTLAQSSNFTYNSTTKTFQLGYDNSNYFSTTINSTGNATLDLVGTSPKFTFSDPVIISNLTSGRVPIITTSGEITDSANLTFATATLTLGVSGTAQGVLKLAQSIGVQTTSINAATSGSSLTFTLPSSAGSSGQALTGNGTGGLSFATLGAGVGGTGITSYAVGDLIYASASTTLSKLADVAVGSYLRSGGVTTAPLWSTLKLPNSATANYVAYATSSNTWGESANLTFNGSTLTVTGNVSTNNLLLPTTTSSVGQIQQNGNRFIHTYGTSNIFVGDGAGNFTLTGSNNQAFGPGGLQYITSGIQNCTFGVSVGTSVQNGSYLTLMGYGAGGSMVATQEASAFGANALTSATGNYNSAFGSGAGYSVSTGTRNTLAGWNAGFVGGAAITTGSSNSVFGAGAGVDSSSSSYRTVIGAAAVGKSDNTVTLGGTGTTAWAKTLVSRGKAADVFAAVGGVIFDHYADVGNVGTGEDDLYSDTLQANVLATNGDKIRAYYAGITANNANGKTIKVYFGGTAIFDSTSLGIVDEDWQIDVQVIRESSTVVRCSVKAMSQLATLTPYVVYTRITGLTLSNTQIIKITGEATDTDDIVAKQATIEYLPAA